MQPLQLPYHVPCVSRSRSHCRCCLWVALLALVAARAAADEPVTVRGQVLGLDRAPVEGAAIDILREGASVSAGRSGPDGSFTVRCAATGPHNVRASRAGARAQETERFPLSAGRTFDFTFVLVPEAPTAANPAPSGERSWLMAPLPNPVVFHAGGRPFTLRAAGVGVAIIAVALVLLNVLVLGRRLGWKKRRLSGHEVGDLVFNKPQTPFAERVQPIAVVGAVGVEWSLVYGVAEIKTMMAARQRWLLALSLASPVLVGLAVLGLLVAMLVGQERYLFVGMSLVPAGFFIVPAIIALKARGQLRAP